MKRHSPSAARNKGPIGDVLSLWLPPRGLVLEMASGSGEHAVEFAARFPLLSWQPSDPDPAALASIAAWQAEAGLDNLRPPIQLDAAAAHWPVERAEALLAINMVHISRWQASLGLFAGAARLLPMGGPLILYGPYLEQGVETAPSNLVFDQSLKARNADWGLRDVAEVQAAAAEGGLKLCQKYAMPANNLMLLFRKADGA